MSSCTERTMPDGSHVRVTVEAGPAMVPHSTMIQLTAIRPNGLTL